LNKFVKIAQFVLLKKKEQTNIGYDSIVDETQPKYN
jgi:hypothetical protein